MVEILILTIRQNTINNKYLSVLHSCVFLGLKRPIKQLFIKFHHKICKEIFDYFLDYHPKTKHTLHCHCNTN